MNNKLDNANKKLIFFISMMALGGLSVLFYLAATGNDNQVFTDVVIEYTSRYGINKSAERSLFYIFPVVGALIYACVFVIRKWNTESTLKDEIKSSNFVFVALAVSFIVNLVVYKSVNYFVIAAVLLACIAKSINEKKVIPAASFFYISVYALCGIYRFYVLCHGSNSANINMITFIAAVITIVSIVLFENEKGIIRGIQVAQLFIPFTLLIYTLSSYKTVDGTIVTIGTPKRAWVLIAVVIVVFIAEAICIIKENWKDADLQGTISFGACVSIMAFNRFSGTGSIADFDLHHHFENVIGFSQIFELGQKPFTEYIPVSGMYSVIHGFFLWFFGHGMATYYFLSTNLFFLAVIIAIVFLLRRQLKAEWVLFIAITLLVADYNRVALIIPIILLLTWPALIDNKNLWLKTWFLTSFVHGLYYPVFGAAVCFAFLPLGLWQIVSYAKSGELAKDVKTAKFWVWWIVCFIPAVAGIKLLIGTAKHMLAMGGQTIYADGITRFSQVLPEAFFSYVSSFSLRVILYYLASYMIMITVIWLSVALALKCGELDLGGKLPKIKNPQGVAVAISIALMMLVGFSFTVVRFDVGDLYSRSAGMMKAAFVVLILIIARFIKKNDRNILWIFAFTIFTVSIVSAEGFNTIGNGPKLQAYYDVPEEDSYVVDTNIRLGECFINSGSYEYITRINNYFATLDNDASYLGLVDSFGLDYLCNIKGASVIEIFNTIKGYGATQETVENLRNTKGIVGRNINPDSNYYFYHWLITSGEYVWDDNVRLFLPNDGSLSKEEVIARHKYLDLSYADAISLGRTQGSWGSSMETLDPIFKELNVACDIKENAGGTVVSFERSFDGNEADFIYLDYGDLKDNYKYIVFNGADDETIDPTDVGLLSNLLKKDYNPNLSVKIFWTDDSGSEHVMVSDMDEGKLLIPLGSGAGWLLNSHTYITISVTDEDGMVVEMPINKLRLLKLREVQ